MEIPTADQLIRDYPDDSKRIEQIRSATDEMDACEKVNKPTQVAQQFFNLVLEDKSSQVITRQLKTLPDYLTRDFLFAKLHQLLDRLDEKTPVSPPLKQEKVDAEDVTKTFFEYLLSGNLKLISLAVPRETLVEYAQREWQANEIGLTYSSQAGRYLGSVLRRMGEHMNQVSADERQDRLQDASSIKELLHNKKYEDVERYINDISSKDNRFLTTVFSICYPAVVNIYCLHSELTQELSNPSKVEKPLTLAILLKITDLLVDNKMDEVVRLLGSDLSEKVQFPCLCFSLWLAFGRQITLEEMNNYMIQYAAAQKASEKPTLWLESTLKTIAHLYKTGDWTRRARFLDSIEPAIGYNVNLVEGFYTSAQLSNLKNGQGVIRFSNSVNGALVWSRMFSGQLSHTLIVIKEDGSYEFQYDDNNRYIGSSLLEVLKKASDALGFKESLIEGLYRDSEFTRLQKGFK